ncbi:MAG TPA: hypothetical protein VIN93_06085 [Bryobacteraceae bacterium]|jgi:hypothetical protein
MPEYHFMAADVRGSLLAMLIFPLFVWAPGYLLGFAFNLFEFRTRSAAFRAVLSLPLAIALCPILTYFAARCGSMNAAQDLYLAADLAVLALLAFDAKHGWARRPRLPEGWAFFAAAIGVWLLITLFDLVDVQAGSRLYYPTNSLDYSLRASLVHSVATTGVPPQTPLFLPGPPAALRYHYFWLMMCALVNRLGSPWVSARHAEIAGAFWCGVGLMALLAACLRLFVANPQTGLARRLRIGVLLMGITGLDILPGMYLLFLYVRGQMNFVLPSLECWNEYVDWFLHSAIWAPHAIAALIAVVTGFLLLWHGASKTGWPDWARYGLVAGLALASAAGACIWVTFTFAAFLCVWTAICIARRWRREVTVLVIAGIASCALAYPYLHDLGAGPVTGSPLHFTVRAFSMTALVPVWPAMPHWLRLILVNGSLLPLNYALEFGFFFFVAGIKWRQHRASGEPLSRQDAACVTMLVTSALICTFLRSSVNGNNDLGWRGFLPAQFVLLLWAADIWPRRDRLSFLSTRRKRLLTACIALGAAGTVYEIAIVSFYPMLADRGVLPPLKWMAPDRQFGKRNYAARAAYEWVRASTPETAALQYNPDVDQQQTDAMLYADRRIVAAGSQCDTPYGGDPKLCGPILARLERLYPPAGQPAATSLTEICRDLPIDVIVVKDTDPVWSDTHSWVWAGKPVFSNAYIRLFSCHGTAVDPLVRR